jgi:hypothetical protein
MEWFVNIEKQPLEITKAADNTLITSHPEDMFNVIHVQVCLSSVLHFSAVFCAVLWCAWSLHCTTDCAVGSAHS